jgi:hypothetical protein
MAETYRELGATRGNRSPEYLLEDWIEDLRGKRGLEVYQHMSEGDPVAGAALHIIETILRSAKWQTLPAEDEPTAEADRLFLEGCLADMSHTTEDFISDAATMLSYGFSVFEIVYKVRGGSSDDATRKSRFDDNRVGWRKLAWRDPLSLSKWLLDDAGGIQGVRQTKSGGAGYVDIPIEKLLLLRTKNNGNRPFGRSILRSAYRPWMFKRNIENIEGIGVERDLAGYPVATVPMKWLSDSATPEEQAIVKQVAAVVKNLRRNEAEGAIMPSDYGADGKPLIDLKLLTTGGRRQFDIGSTVGRKNTEIALATLTDFMLLGHTNVGTQALEGGKRKLFAQALNTVLRAIASPFNAYAVPRLFILNGWARRAYPRWEPVYFSEYELSEIAALFKDLRLSVDPELENYLRSRAQLPPRPEGDGRPEDDDDDSSREGER